uniref:Endoplasmic reticulum transmembrane protein n=1 Tax=Glossina palpalis gambiensis TaxID=67801 RepID=A0A1B0AUQ5_9MUSC
MAQIKLGHLVIIFNVIYFGSPTIECHDITTKFNVDHHLMTSSKNDSENTKQKPRVAPSVFKDIFIFVCGLIIVTAAAVVVEIYTLEAHLRQLVVSERQ